MQAKAAWQSMRSSTSVASRTIATKILRTWARMTCMILTEMGTVKRNVASTPPYLHEVPPESEFHSANAQQQDADV